MGVKPKLQVNQVAQMASGWYLIDEEFHDGFLFNVNYVVAEKSLSRVSRFPLEAIHDLL